MPRLPLAVLGLALAACTERATPRSESTAHPPPLPSASVAPGVSGPAAATALAAPGSAPAATSAAPSGEVQAGVPEGMALVPGGPFTMGADHGGEEDEHPAHTVTVAPFYLDLTEVTNESWGRCVTAGVCPPIDASSAGKNGFGSDVGFRGPRQPVSSISWEAARGYCAWLGKRLPTEAEWEKAARGTDGRRYPWGKEEPTPDRAVYGGTSLTQDVGTHPRGDGPYGHHDLAGNVWEWVEDVYDPYSYQRPGAAEGKGSTCEQSLEAFADIRTKGKKGFTGSNPLPTQCERVLRGGAFNYAAPGLRSSNRVHHPPRYHLVMSGFRCARDAAAR